MPALKALAERMRYTVNVEGGHRYTLKRSWSPPGFSKNTPHCYSYTQLVSEAKQPMHCSASARRPVPRSSDARPTKASHRKTCSRMRRSTMRATSWTLTTRFGPTSSTSCGTTTTSTRRHLLAYFGSDVTAAAPVAVSAWHAEGAVELSDDRLTLKDESRSDRLRRLLWLVPDRHLEHEVGRRQGLDLTPDGVAYMAQELAAGQVLHANHSFAGIDKDGRVLITCPDKSQMRFRVAPGLSDGEGVRLVLESTPPRDAEARKDLTRAMAQLRRVLRSAL